MTADNASLPFTHPDRQRFFEDYVQDDLHDLGDVSVDEAEIVEFARRYDPQDIHTSREKAENGLFNGLIASGWQTAGLMMSLYARHYLCNAASIASLLLTTEALVTEEPQEEEAAPAGGHGHPH